MKFTVLSVIILFAILFQTFAADVIFKQSPPSATAVKELRSGSCKCVSYDCGCCLYLDLPKFKINDTGCVDITYLPKDYGIRVTFTVDGHVYIKEEVSARSPPPICFAVPHLTQEASICLDFYNLDIADHVFSGCVKLQARLYRVVTEDIKLGCFKMKLPFTNRRQMSELKKLRAALKNRLIYDRLFD